MGKKTAIIPNSTDREQINSPTAWFATLERARNTDNYAMAARAKSELKRLGVTVKFTHGVPRGGSA